MFRITALNARNIAKHQPVCGRCGGSILDNKCVPREERLLQLGQATDAGFWYCTACECNHPPRMAIHERRGVQMCDQGAYDFDMHQQREAS